MVPLVTGDPKVRELETVTLAFGDTNLDRPEVLGLADLAEAVWLPGYPPDHGMARGPIDLSSRRAEVLGRLGSDAHHALIYRLHIAGEVDPFVVLVWNVWVGQRAETVRGTLGDLQRGLGPFDAIVLLEAYRLRDMLEGFAAARGYWHQQSPTGTEGAGVALLVRKAKGRKLIGRGFLRCREPWIGPKEGRRHDPREWPRLRVRLASGRRVRLIGWHGVTGGPSGPNGEAVREGIRKLAAWVRRS